MAVIWDVRSEHDVNVSEQAFQWQMCMPVHLCTGRGGVDVELGVNEGMELAAGRAAGMGIVVMALSLYGLGSCGGIGRGSSERPDIPRWSWRRWLASTPSAESR